MQDIRRARLLDGARNATGITVIIDVFRAFTVAAWAAALGARPLAVVAEAERALQLKARHARAVLSGESGGWPLPGFDLGNSPTELLQMTARGQTPQGRPFIQRTSAGTQGVMAARRASHLFVAGLVVARATAEAVARLAARVTRTIGQPPPITLVAMGYEGRSPAVEDELCADALEAYLLGRPFQWASGLAAVAAAERTRWLLAGEFPPFPPSDVSLALCPDLFPFALRARVCGDVAVLHPVYPGAAHREAAHPGAPTSHPAAGQPAPAPAPPPPRS